MKNSITITTIDGEELNLTFYTDIRHLPIKRYQLLQKYSLIDAGVGSTIADIFRHFNRLDQFIEAKDIESIAIERENMLMNYQFISSGSYTKTYTFASLIHTINKKIVEIDDTNIDEYVQMLEDSNISVLDLSELVESQKKSLVSSYH